MLVTQRTMDASTNPAHLVIDRGLYNEVREMVQRHNSVVASPVRWTITGVIQTAIAEYLERQRDVEREEVA